jgi:hypothetical protein
MNEENWGDLIVIPRAWAKATFQDGRARYLSADGTQYESVEMISPQLRDPSAQNGPSATESLRNRTEPSLKTTLAPPGWSLARMYAPGASDSSTTLSRNKLGGHLEPSPAVR